MSDSLNWFRPSRPSGHLAALLIIFAAISAVGCNPVAQSREQANSSTSGRLSVVCTTGQVSDMVQRVGGEHLDVISIMGPGVDPHLYQATPRDIDAFNQAGVIFYSGLHLEGRLADRLEAMASERPTFAVTEVLKEKYQDVLISPDEFDGHHDPHVWFDPTIWAHCIRFVGDRLAEQDPKNGEAYLANAQAYADELVEAHARWQQQLASIDATRRVLVTAHDAFGYFGKSYGIEVRGLQGISTADETDLSTVNELVDLLVSRKIKAVFVESSVSQRYIKSLVEGCQAKGHTVKIGGELFSDAMGALGTTEGTYIGMMNHNVQTIVESLR